MLRKQRADLGDGMKVSSSLSYLPTWLNYHYVCHSYCLGKKVKLPFLMAAALGFMLLPQS